MERAWPVPVRESELRDAAAPELPVLELADEVSRLLVEVVQRVSIDAGKTDRTPAELRLHALWFMAIVSMRALRAAMAVLSVGYEDQAVGYQRLVDELHNRAQKVRGDADGTYSRRWLHGRGMDKGAKLAGQGFWELLSGPVHANSRAVLDWLAVTQPDGSAKVVIGPERRPEVANAALTFMAGEARDLSSMLAAEAGFQLDLRAIDARLDQARATWIPGDEDE